MPKYKVSISYPPLESSKGTPFLSQNRQFQWTNTGNVILPVISAYGATLLNKLGYKVYWDDAIAEKISFDKWFDRLKKRKPSLVFIETKTPVINRHWQIIKKIKINLPTTTIVLMGDHVTAFPEDSFLNSPIDYVITGGDYDFMMINLTNHLFKHEKLKPGFYYRKNNHIVNSGKFALKHHRLDTLPIINRQLTKWKLYAFNNTNFKHKPGAYIMSGRDCWWGKCTFCSWTTLHPHGSYRHFSVDHTINEIENLVSLGIKEIFDDSGTLPVGKWLDDLCHQLIKKSLNKKITFSCNMRFGALNQSQYNLMAKAGFRFILYGLESANQKTLSKIDKNTSVAIAKKSLLMAKKSGLSPHITVMIGYPWESLADAKKTLNLARYLLSENLAKSIQATLIIPYPGTPLFKYCQQNKLLKTTSWDKYDMRQPVIKSPISDFVQVDLIKQLFKGVLTPRFLLSQILAIRSINDITHLFNYSIKFLKKLKDFS